MNKSGISINSKKRNLIIIIFILNMIDLVHGDIMGHLEVAEVVEVTEGGSIQIIMVMFVIVTKRKVANVIKIVTAIVLEIITVMTMRNRRPTFQLNKEDRYRCIFCQASLS